MDGESSFFNPQVDEEMNQMIETHVCPLCRKKFTRKVLLPGIFLRNISQKNTIATYAYVNLIAAITSPATSKIIMEFIHQVPNINAPNVRADLQEKTLF